MKGLFRNTIKDFAAGLLVAAIVLLVVFAGMKLLANETKPLRDFRASIHILP